MLQAGAEQAGFEQLLQPDEQPIRQPPWHFFLQQKIRSSRLVLQQGVQQDEPQPVLQEGAGAAQVGAQLLQPVEQAGLQQTGAWQQGFAQVLQPLLQLLQAEGAAQVGSDGAWQAGVEQAGAAEQQLVAQVGLQHFTFTHLTLQHLVSQQLD